METSFDFMGQRPGLTHLPPVAVTELTGEEFGRGLSRLELAKKADERLRQLQRGDGLPNDDTGWNLRINRDGRKKMGDNADQSAAESKAVAGLERLVKSAVVVERHADLDHHNPDVAAILRLYAPLAINGELFRVKLTVKNYSTAGTRKLLHALAAVEIENAPPGISLSYSGAEALQTAQPTTGRTMNIADFLHGTIMNDGVPLYDF